jgi:hypothetical protein
MAVLEIAVLVYARTGSTELTALAALLARAGTLRRTSAGSGHRPTVDGMPEIGGKLRDGRHAGATSARQPGQW